MLDDAVGILREYISMESIFFVPFLIFIGRIIKKSRKINDCHIPSILGIMAVILCTLLAIVNNSPLNWIQWIILICVSIGQGICVAGVSVYVNQWFKQNQKYKDLKKFDGNY